ncbi:MAG: hypothetical protein AAF708_14210 [Deinococcota bacterium]
MFALNAKPRFNRELKAFVKKQPDLVPKVRAVLEQLQTDPRAASLRSHKVIDSDGQPMISSLVTGDLRIGWNYGTPGTIDLLRFGSHSGSRKIYR